jgi:hypothetical protein
VHHNCRKHLPSVRYMQRKDLNIALDRGIHCPSGGNLRTGSSRRGERIAYWGYHICIPSTSDSESCVERIAIESFYKEWAGPLMVS